MLTDAISMDSALAVVIFIAVSSGVVAAWQFASSTLRQYRSYFERQVGPALQRSFIRANATYLFAASLLGITLMTLVGYAVAGSVGAVVCLMTGALVPKLALKILKQRRAEELIRQLPDALHSLASTLRSGINLPKGLEQLARWQPKPLSQEIGLVLAEYQIGKDLGDALDGMQSRINRPELELMNGAIKISRSVGGNLADTLEALADTLNEKLTVEGKIKALTAMGRLQGWVVSAVPVLMGVAMYFTNPDQIMPLFTEFRGWVTLSVISVMMVAAVVSIRRIVSIDV